MITKDTSASGGWNGSFTVQTGICASGSMLFCTSDETLKDFGDNVEVNFEDLKKVKKAYYKWKSNPNSETFEIGTSAQDIASLYPELVCNDDGRLLVSYDRLSIIALAAIDKLYDRIKYLEDQLNNKI